MTTAVNGINVIDTFLHAGAQTILVPNVPDLGLVPAVTARAPLLPGAPPLAFGFTHITQACYTSFVSLAGPDTVCPARALCVPERGTLHSHVSSGHRQSVLRSVPEPSSVISFSAGLIGPGMRGAAARRPFIHLRDGVPTTRCKSAPNAVPPSSQPIDTPRLSASMS